MKKLAKCLFSGILVVMMVSSLLGASASTYSSLYLDSYRASLTPKSGGLMVVSADILGRGDQKVIGVTQIILYESKDNKNFYQVGSYLPDRHPNMLSSGSVYVADIVTYLGTPGYYYKASVYCYAGDGTNGTERNYMTNSRQALP